MLDAAKEWGCKPWDIAGGNRVVWWYRYQARRDEEIKVMEQLRKK